VRTLAESIDDPEAGRKARTLGCMARAGLPVPPGFVLHYDELIEDRLLDAGLTALGGPRFAVRSSSSIEDSAEGSAAGVFESVIGVSGLANVKAAIVRVRNSAHDEPARAYLSARNISLSDVRVAVLLQPEVTAALFGIARSEPGGFLVEERQVGEPEWGDVIARRLDRDDPSALGDGLRRLEALLGSALDVEFARTGDEVIFLQARPLLAPPAAREFTFPLRGRWQRDAEHNPDPLSMAQTGLVERMEALAVGPRQCVVGGYLYYERESARAAASIPIEELESRYRSDIAPDCEARLAAVEEASVDQALSAYAHVYRRYASEVSPALRQLWRELTALLETLGVPRSARGDLFGGTAGLTRLRDESLYRLGQAKEPEQTALLNAHLARYGAYAPAWDVAVPTDDECPDRVRAMGALWAESDESPTVRHERAARTAVRAAARLSDSLAGADRSRFEEKWRLAQQVLPLSEDDDLLFFRAQRAVRRALLRRGQELVEAGRLDHAEDVFDLPLDVAASADLRQIAAAQRTLRREAARLVPPITVDEGVGRTAPPRGRLLRGHATFGRAEGRALLVRSPADVPMHLPPDAILVVPAILPSLTFLLPAARALVTAHGGTTSHGATLAREYGVPAVLGAGEGALVASGTRLFVDGQLGRIYVLDP
jgi:phosphohistidine swiveling domain-containing protein